MYEIPEHIRKYIKKELYDYWDNQELLKELQEQTINISTSNLNGSIRGSGISDPTYNNAQSLINNKTIAILTKNINAIAEMEKQIDQKGKELFIKIFKNKKTQIDMENEISEGSYKHQKNKIIYLTAVKLKLL